MATGTLLFGLQTQIKNVLDPVDNADAATKLYVDGKTGAGSVAAAGSNTQIQFNSAGSIGASANLTFDYSGNILTIGGNLVSKNANLGNLAVANYINIANNLQVAGDANIVGNLTVLGAVSYIQTTTTYITDPIAEIGGAGAGSPLLTNDNMDRGSLLHYYTTKPVDAFIGWDNSNAEFALAGNVTVLNNVVTYNDFGNVRIGNLAAGNLVHANYFTGDGGLLSNIVSSSGTAATVSASAQPNITSVGALVDLTVGQTTSNVYIDGSGNITAAGTVSAAEVIITSLTATRVPFVDSDKSLTDSGNLTFDSSTKTLSSDLFTGTLTTAAQPNVTTVGTLEYLTVSGDTNVQGNLTVGGTLTYIDSTKVSLVDPILELGGGADGAALSTNDSKDRGTLLHYYTTKSLDAFMGWKNSDGQFVFGSNVLDIAGAVTVNEYANVKAATFLGNLIGDYANVSNINFTNTITGGNLVTANYVTGTVTTHAQPNITSVGTLTGLTVSGKTDLSTVGNVKITGGTTGQYLQTDGSGNLSWVTISSATISTGSSNVIVNSDGNVTISSGGTSNVLLVSSTGVTINGDLTDIGNGTMNTLSITGTVASTDSTTGALKVAGGVGIVGNVNINSKLTVNGMATLANLTVNGNLVAGNASFSEPVTFTSPADSTDPTTGALILTLGGLGVHGNINAGEDVQGVTLTGNITTAAQPNITSLGTLTSLRVSGSGNIATANLGNLIVTKLSNLGPVSNVTITGGYNGQYLSTDGSGNLSWQSAASTNSIVNGSSNVTVNNDGNVTVSSSNHSNVIIVNGTAVNVYGTLNVSSLTSLNTLHVTSTTDSTTYNSGSVILSGGIGIAGNIITNENLIVNGNTFTNDTTIQGNSIVQGTANFENILTVTAVADSINPSTGAVILTTGGLGVAGNINSSQGISGETLTGTLTTHAQPNITSVGTLSSLTVTGKITGGNIYANSGTIGASLLTGTLTTAAQPNVTSLGTLSDLSVAGNTTTGNLIVDTSANLGLVSNIIITGGTSGQYLQTDGAGNVSWKTVSTSALVNGTSNIVINPSGNINLSANGSANVLKVTSTQIVATPTTDTTSTTTGAIVVNGGVGIAGNLYIGGILNVSGDFQVGNLNTSGPVAHTGEVSFTQTTYFTNATASTNTTSGAVQITGGLGVQGNIFGGGIVSGANIQRDGKNVPTFTSSGTLPTNPMIGDEWYDQGNDRIYQYIYDGSNYNWIDVSSGYISANVQAQAGTVVVRDSNGNVYANTLVANELDVQNLVITGTTSISSMVSAGTGQPVSNTNDTIIDQFPKTSYRSAKYIISARNDDGYEVLEALLIHDDSISYIQTYGDLTVGNPNSLLDVADIITLSSNIVGGNVRLYAIGSNSNTLVNLVSTYVTD